MNSSFKDSYAIEINRLHKIYMLRKGRRVEALRDLSLSISSGEIFGFLGPNGAGKSTTIKILVGLVAPTSGTAFIRGTEVSSPVSRQSIGYLPENPAFYDFLTAREYLTFVGRSFGMTPNILTREIDRVLDTLSLAEASQRPIRGFSKGMVQRLGLAQTLLHDPEIYILDEPMSGLDPLGRALVKDIIRNLKQKGKTVFFSSHVTADVEAICDRVGVIYKGELQSVDDVQGLLKSGIAGYTIHLNGGRTPELSLAGFTAISQRHESVEFYVPADQFSEFMAQIQQVGAKVSFIEPKRKDLEAFFLEIIKKGRD